MRTDPPSPELAGLDDLDRTAVNLFGLGSPVLMRALLVYGCVHLVVTVAACWNMRAPATWFALVAGFVMFVGAAAALMRFSESELPRRLAWAVTAATVAGFGVSLASLPQATYMTLQTTPATSALTILLVMVVLYGHPVIAWIGAAAGTASAAAAGAMTGVGSGVLVGNTVFCYPVLMIATLFALMATPMPERIRRIRADVFARAAAEAATRAAAGERDRQMARLDARARPILRRIADGCEFPPAEVGETRLTEAQMRDIIRAPAWDCAEVREAVWTARRQGVSVRLLDDGVSREGNAVIRRARAMLVDELVALNGDAAELTARVLPPGRPLVASIVVQGVVGFRKIEFHHDGATVRVDDPDPGLMATQDT
ncbi:hypothetical protein ACWFOS_08760 [Gordonia terrae]